MSATPLLGEALRQLAAEEPVRLTVRGDCMRPLLVDGQAVTVAGARRYRPGDVVAWTAASGGGLVVHRVIGYRWRGGRPCLQTRADASGTLDPPVDPERVIGRVVDPPLPARRLRNLWRFARLWLGGHLPR